MRLPDYSVIRGLAYFVDHKKKREMVGQPCIVLGLVLLATDLSSAVEPVQIDPLAPKHRLPPKQKRRAQDVQQRPPPPREADMGEPMLAHNVHRPERFDPVKHPRVTALDSDADADNGADARTPKLAYNVHRPERYDPSKHPRQHPELAHELAGRPRPQQETSADVPTAPAWEPTQGRAYRK